MHHLFHHILILCYFLKFLFNLNLMIIYKIKIFYVILTSLFFHLYDIFYYLYYLYHIEYLNCLNCLYFCSFINLKILLI